LDRQPRVFGVPPERLDDPALNGVADSGKRNNRWLLKRSVPIGAVNNRVERPASMHGKLRRFRHLQGV